MNKLLAFGLMLFSGLVVAQTPAPELLQIIDKSTKYVVNTPKGPIEITRVMTPCAKNKGWLQPLIPIKGVVPVDEIDVLNGTPTSLVLLPIDVVQKLLKTKDDEKTVKWVCDNNGTLFDIGSIYEEIEVVKKHLIEDTDKGTVLHEVIEIKTADSRNAERYLLKHELTKQEYIKNKVNELGLSTKEMISRFGEFEEEWRETLG